MDYIALYHIRDNMSQVSLRRQDAFEELAQKACIGDTLHKIPEDLKHSSQAIFDLVRLQITQGKYVLVEN